MYQEDFTITAIVDAKLIDFGYINPPSSMVVAGSSTFVTSVGECDNKMVLMSSETEPGPSRSVKILVRS